MKNVAPYMSSSHKHVYHKMHLNEACEATCFRDLQTISQLHMLLGSHLKNFG